MTPRISTPAKTLGIAALLGLAFWIGVYAAIEKYGLGTVVTWGIGIVAIAAFLGLVRDAFAAAKDARRNFDVDPSSWAFQERINRLERERRFGAQGAQRISNERVS